jgi:hypothetical protein
MWHYHPIITAFQITIDSFLAEMTSTPVNDLKMFITKESKEPKIFVQHLEGLLE